jgi:hypothetical protein
MKFKSMASLLALSFAVLTAVPAPAAQAAHPAKLTRHLVRHRAAECRVVCRKTVFGPAIERRPTAQYQSPPAAPKDDWPANMILDSFRSHEVSGVGKMAAPYVI